MPFGATPGGKGLLTVTIDREYTTGMDTAKQALLKAGRIAAITRGRISLDNHAWLKSQYDNGVRFSDWPKGEMVVDKTTPGKVRVKRDPAVVEQRIYDTIVYTFDEKYYRATNSNTGAHVGMREVCNNCRVSLVQCHCDKPTVLGDIPVTIVPRAG